MKRTLRGRVSLLAIGVIAVWLFVLTVAFNLFLVHRLRTQSQDALRVKAQAASSTVAVDDSGRVRVRESATDSALDSGVWIFAGRRAVERPAADDELQEFAQSLADHGEGFVDRGDADRAYVLPVAHATVVVVASTAAEHRAEKIALAGSAVISLLMLAVAYPVMRLAVRRALDPVDAMAQQAADWSASETSRRFGPGQRYEELRALAGDLDGLLDRLSAVLRHERQLSGEISHELRTPLASIAAEADLLVSSGAPADRDAHRAIADAARSMDRIIDTLLEAARAESSSLSGTCRVADVLAGVGEGVVVTGADDVIAGVDAALLERILVPVLDNARRYARSAVTVDVARADGTVRLDIGNDGPPVADPDRIFEPGHRGTPDDGHPGAGLGLPLARRLAQAADGNVALVPGGTGATFRVTVPAG